MRVMKTLSVALVLENYHRGGGVERRTSELAHGLLAAGHDVHVYSMGYQADGNDDGISFHRIPVLKLGRRIKALSFAWSCSAFIPRARHDIIHTQARIYRYNVATMGVGCHKAYMDAMDVDADTDREAAFHRAMLSIERAMMAKTQSDGAKIITNSHRCKSEFIRYYGVPETSITVIHNGVDQITFTPNRESAVSMRENLGLSPEDTMLLFVGGGFQRKGLDTLIRALGRLRNKNARVAIVGRGGRDEWNKLAADLGVLDALIWCGKADAEQMASYYAAADAFVLPTRYDPFANSTMEALASGLPVITSTANGVSEILKDGESALLMDAGDAEALADRLSTVMRDEALRLRLGLAGRKAVEPYTWQATTEKTMNIYGSVMSDE